uniref:Uncharacterized protein n=1 Tax=Lepeophtheirus salmonis TaxID=72036 RepID=A0A0K2U8D9_LEPSM
MTFKLLKRNQRNQKLAFNAFSNFSLLLPILDVTLKQTKVKQSTNLFQKLFITKSYLPNAI